MKPSSLSQLELPRPRAGKGHARQSLGELTWVSGPCLGSCRWPVGLLRVMMNAGHTAPSVLPTPV